MLKKFKASNLCIGKESRRASWVHVVGSDDPEKNIVSTVGSRLGSILGDHRELMDL